MKTALWLYLFLSLRFFDLHAQYPILTPFAISLGAGPAFIGWMMGMYSLTHLPGNLLAGVLVDRNGSRRYIVFSLTVAGAILLLQAHAQLPGICCCFGRPAASPGISVPGLHDPAGFPLVRSHYSGQVYVRPWHYPYAGFGRITSCRSLYRPPYRIFRHLYHLGLAADRHWRDGFLQCT